MGPLFAAFILATGAAVVCTVVFGYVRVRHRRARPLALRSAVFFTVGAALGGGATALLLAALLGNPDARLSETWQVLAYLAALGAGACAGGVALPALCSAINYRSSGPWQDMNRESPPAPQRSTKKPSS